MAADHARRQPRAHELGEVRPRRTPRPAPMRVSPASGAPGSDGASAQRHLNPTVLLRLQATAGNRAVERMLQPQVPSVQRHPSHAEEEIVQTLPVQRLGIGEPVEELTVAAAIETLVSRYHFKNTKSLRNAVERLHGEKATFASFDALASRMREQGLPVDDIERKRLVLEAKFHVPIGAEVPGDRFGEKMLDQLDAVFSRVPPSHLQTLGAVTRRKANEASSFEHEDRILTVAYDIPEWLYAWAAKNTSLLVVDARSEMEKVAVAEMLGGTGHASELDTNLGLDTKKRSVTSYSRDDPFASNRIVEWTLLHELGHAVDRQVRWTARRGKEDEFGGWITHGGRNDEEARGEVAVPYLKACGLSDEALGELGVESDKIKRFKSVVLVQMLQTSTDAAAGILSGFSKSHGGELKKRLLDFFRTLHLAQAAPWQFPGGLAQDLDVDGRVYQLDHYGTWVSYKVAARGRILSPYQFSSPGEWIAEAYAAFYGAKTAARAILSAGTRQAIAEELGPPPDQKGKAPEGALEAEMGAWKQEAGTGEGGGAEPATGGGPSASTTVGSGGLLRPTRASVVSSDE